MTEKNENDQDRNVQEKTQGEDLPKEEPQFVDPNSGAAPQPGGFAHVMVETDEKSKEAEPAVDPTYDAEVEHSAGPAGKQPGNPDGVNASEAGQSEEDQDPEGKGGDAGDSQSGSSGESEGGQSQADPKAAKKARGK